MNKLIIFFFILVLQIYSQNGFEIISYKIHAKLYESENGTKWSHFTRLEIRILPDFNKNSYIPFSSFHDNPIFNNIKSVRILRNEEDETDELLSSSEKETSLGKTYKNYYLKHSELKKLDLITIEGNSESKENINNLHFLYFTHPKHSIGEISLKISIPENLYSKFAYKLFNSSNKPEIERSNGIVNITFNQKNTEIYEDEVYSAGFYYNAPYIKYYLQYKDWSEAYSKNDYFEKFRSCIADTNGLGKVIKSININSTLKDEAFINDVFLKIQKKYQYAYIDLHLDGYIPHNISHIDFMKKADCKDYTRILINIFRYYGYKAYMIDLMTNYQKIKFDPDIHYLYQFNHAILYVETNKGRPYFLDGTGKLFSINDIRADVQGLKALLVNDLENQIKVIKIPEKKPDENKIEINLEGKISENKKLSGSITFNFYSTMSHDIRELFHRNNKKEIREYFIKEFKLSHSMTIKNIEALNFNSYRDTVTVKLDIELEKLIESLGDKIVFRSHFLQTRDYTQLKYRNRSYNYYFSYPPNSISYSYSITNNTGKTVSFQPESIKIENNLFLYLSDFSVQKDKLKYQIKITRKLSNYPKTEKRKLRSFIKKVEENINNYIILN